MHIEAQKTTVETVDGDFPSIEAFREAHPGFVITDIDGREVLGVCEGCEKLILEDINFTWTEDGDFCAKCIESMTEDDQ
jgi:hypothetical protein